MNQVKAWLIAKHRFATAAKWSVYHFMTLFYGLRVTGKEHIPKTGGVIIAANHLSVADPPVVGSVLPRHVSFMAKKELFVHPFSRFVMEILHAYPVDRERNDMQAIKQSLHKLKDGEMIGIFFEGQRNQGSAQARGGAAFLAQRADVPIVPTAIWREGRNFRVRFGEPLYPQHVLTAGASRKDKVQMLTQELTNHVKALQEAA